MQKYAHANDAGYLGLKADDVPTTAGITNKVIDPIDCRQGGSGVDPKITDAMLEAEPCRDESATRPLRGVCLLEKIIERVSLQDMQSRLADVKETLMRIGFRQDLGRHVLGHASLLRVQACAFLEMRRAIRMGVSRRPDHSYWPSPSRSTAAARLPVTTLRRPSDFVREQKGHQEGHHPHEPRP